MRIRRGLDAVTLLLLAGTFGYLAYGAFEPWRDPGLVRRLFSPQEGVCVIREDVCKVVEHLRRSGAAVYEMRQAEMTPELYQRMAEFAYPIRIAPKARLRVGLCTGREPGDDVDLRLKDVKQTGNDNADICVFRRA